MYITRVGGPTLLVELADWRILIDPTLDPPGRRYRFGFGTSSVKTRGPAVNVDQIGAIDLILLSHDQHADNLDVGGRALLPSARHVITTAAAARRLKLTRGRGLLAGQTVRLDQPDRHSLTVTATPCRHGPPLSSRLVGEVIGFALTLPPEETTRLWVSGDTVLYPELVRTAAELDVDVAIINAGGVRFGLTGPLHYTMTGPDLVELVTTLQPRVAIPAHYDGWTHFRDGLSGLRIAVDTASRTTRDRIRWLPDGIRTAL
jgi:L-ascorbate metabolism protein UlaG (beta-lactamase superfamily)